MDELGDRPPASCVLAEAMHSVHRCCRSAGSMCFLKACRPRVPRLYLHSVEVAVSAFSRLHKINNLRHFKARDGFESLPLRQHTLNLNDLASLREVDPQIHPQKSRSLRLAIPAGYFKRLAPIACWCPAPQCWKLRRKAPPCYAVCGPVEPQ